MLKIGTCGWSSFPAKTIFGDNWKERFESKLQAYASRFGVVEVNSTFYKLPRDSTAEKWADQARETNGSFEFTVKASQEITHKDRFRTEDSIAAWKGVVRIANILGASAILVQTPASFKPNRENVQNISRFFDKARIYWKGKIAWEPRGDWLNEPDEINKICSDFSITHCVDPFRNDAITKGMIYWRIHGLGKPSMYNYRFSDKELEWLAKKAEKRSGYIFFNNIWMGEDAIRFSKLI